MKKLILLTPVCFLLLLNLAHTQDIVSHPDLLTFPELIFDPPHPSELRTELNNGMVVYITEDRELPLIDVSVLIRGGSAWEPPEKIGLASLTGRMLQVGGTTTRSPDQIDEEIEFLAASISTSFGGTSGFASLNILSKDIEYGLELLIDILRNPGFDEERFRIERDRIRQNLARRNDHTSQIEAREWAFLLYGEDHFAAREITIETLEAIGRDDLFEFHQTFVHPGNMILAVAGDFDRYEMLEHLERAFADWEPRESWDEPVPQPAIEPLPGIYLIHKEDVNQGRVRIGHKGTTFDNPDRIAIQVMNRILGGAGFTSRIVSRVRSDKGLAYSAGSAFGIGTHYPGTFVAFFQSRNETCAYGTKIILEEIERIRTEYVTEEELATQINSMLETFPRNFVSKYQTVLLYARDEFEDRDPERWLIYRDEVREITVEDVHRAAQEYLDPENLVILMVGNVDEILVGDPRYDVSLENMDDFEIRRIPLRDPLTLRLE